jgi:hypothetical protein
VVFACKVNIYLVVVAASIKKLCFGVSEGSPPLAARSEMAAFCPP